MHCFSFDIETVPDVEFGRKYFELGDLPDEKVATAMMFKRQQETGSEFLPLHQHRVVAISVALRTGDSFRVWSLGDEESDEADLVGRFFDGIERYAPDLVSWNGSGFDLPVLHYRALRHGIQAPRYWEMGDNDRDYKWNNYLNRFHWRHVDLMDVLAGFQNRGRASLDQMAVLLGFPGKLGMSGDKVWETYLEGGIREIRDYCETDVLNTWLVYLRFEFMRGNLDRAGLDRELALVRETLEGMKETHLDEFLAAAGETEMVPMGSSLKFCVVAEGKADIYPRLGPTSEWDTAAAQAVVEQAGGRVIKTDGEPLDYNNKEAILNPWFLVIGPDDHDWLALVPNAE